MPSATTTSTTTSSRMRLSKPATNPMHPTPPPLPVPTSTAMAIFTKALTWNPPPLIPASAPSRPLSSPSSPRAAATTTTLWMPFWWRRKTPLLNRSRRRATVNSNYGQLAHSGSMGFGVVVAARCREHGEAVAAGNGGIEETAWPATDLAQARSPRSGERSPLAQATDARLGEIATEALGGFSHARLGEAISPKRDHSSPKGEPFSPERDVTSFKRDSSANLACFCKSRLGETGSLGREKASEKKGERMRGLFAKVKAEWETLAALGALAPYGPALRPNIFKDEENLENLEKLEKLKNLENLFFSLLIIVINKKEIYKNNYIVSS
ncbi:hypothetical protein DEO72_LG10g907 [Vigna unguiculata]|uniref:Uncharacterized protein n=1 Tax=Vigna unguiculata TaxID=3917 RepID=A0A4D6NBZ2_VIGUN|nr:hypothetical protein DEO72_LG10g907 [Vigna unguiculata]